VSTWGATVREGANQWSGIPDVPSLGEDHVTGGTEEMRWEETIVIIQGSPTPTPIIIIHVLKVKIPKVVLQLIRQALAPTTPTTSSPSYPNSQVTQQ